MQGAEAIITIGETVKKERIKKRYRHPILDEKIRKLRTRAEYKLLAKASQAGVPVPSAKEIDETTLQLEFIQGPMVKEVLDAQPKLAEQIGSHLRKLHDADIIHADLTTSNMIFQEGLVYFIDFGLSYHSKRFEDKAVDIHLFKQALQSKHHKVINEAFEHFKIGYGEAEETFKRLKKVEARGKNKGS